MNLTNNIKRFIQVFFDVLIALWKDNRAITFDLMRIVFMFISILLGTFVGGMIAGTIGIGGALFGALIVGIVIYYLYSLLSGQPTNIMGAIVFGILNYVSTLITGLVGASTDLGGGIIIMLIQALILSMLWGWLGGKAQKGVKTGLQP